MSAELLAQVRGFPLVAVNGAFRLAPWAVAIAANDAAWWRVYEDAFEAEARRFSANIVPKVERLVGGAIGSDSCSGVIGLEAAKKLGATSIVLLGADFAGGHFFGSYTGILKNTKPERVAIHRKQFRAWQKSNKIPVFNATEGSALDVFPRVTLAEALAA